MFLSSKLVLVCLVAVAARSLVLAGELCQQDPNWQTDFCIYISYSARNNENLLILVKSKKTADNYSSLNLHEPQNVASIDDFYLELVKYKNILQGLNSSMRTYMATSQYAAERVKIDVAKFVRNYLLRVDKCVSEIGQTIDNMSDSVKPTSQPVTPTPSVTVNGKNLVEISAETYYVTNKMASLLGTWLQKCKDCALTRRR